VAAGNRHCLNSTTVVKTGSPDAYDGVALRLEELQEGLADLGGFHRGVPCG
jgi:hypothetical protein